MSKPIDNAIYLKNICPNCGLKLQEVINTSYLYYICNLRELGLHQAPCTLEDWARCPFNKGAKPETNSTTYIDDLLKLKFESRYQFYRGCSQFLKKSKQEVDTHIVGWNLDNPQERQLAWEEVVRKFAGQPTKGG